MTTISNIYNEETNTVSIMDNRWENFTFVFNQLGRCIEILPYDIKFKNAETRNKLCTSVWNMAMGKPGEETMKDTLFETKDGRMGTYVATNRENKYVLEMKDTKGYEAFGKDEVDEVIPYTFDVKFEDYDETAYSFWGTEGAVEVGDLLVRDNRTFCVVVAVDTKSRKATMSFDGRKLLSEKL